MSLDKINTISNLSKFNLVEQNLIVDFLENPTNKIVLENVMNSENREKIFQAMQDIPQQKNIDFLIELKTKALDENISISSLYYNLLNDFSQKINNLISIKKLSTDDLGKIMLMTSFSEENNFFDEDILLENIEIASLLRDAKLYGIDNYFLQKIKLDAREDLQLASSLINNANKFTENFVSKKIISIDQYLFLDSFINSSNDKLIMSNGSQAVVASVYLIQSENKYSNPSRETVVTQLIKKFNKESLLGCDFIDLELSSPD